MKSPRHGRPSWNGVHETSLKVAFRRPAGTCVSNGILRRRPSFAAPHSGTTSDVQMTHLRSARKFAIACC